MLQGYDPDFEKVYRCQFNSLDVHDFQFRHFSLANISQETTGSNPRFVPEFNYGLVLVCLFVLVVNVSMSIFQRGDGHSIFFL